LSGLLRPMLGDVNVVSGARWSPRERGHGGRRDRAPPRAQSDYESLIHGYRYHRAAGSAPVSGTVYVPTASRGWSIIKGIRVDGRIRQVDDLRPPTRTSRDSSDIFAGLPSAIAQINIATFHLRPRNKAGRATLLRLVEGSTAAVAGRDILRQGAGAAGR